MALMVHFRGELRTKTDNNAKKASCWGQSSAGSDSLCNLPTEFLGKVTSFQRLTPYGVNINQEITD